MKRHGRREKGGWLAGTIALLAGAIAIATTIGIASAATAAFKAPQSVKVGERAVLDASGSKPTSAGAPAVKSYAWDLDEDGKADITCGGETSQLVVSFKEEDDKRSVKLTVTDASNATDTEKRTIAVAKSSRGNFLSAEAYQCQRAPSDPPRDVTAGGGPEKGCQDRVKFKLVDAVGCFEKATPTNLSLFPVAERRLLTETSHAKANIAPARAKGDCDAAGKPACTADYFSVMVKFADVYIAKGPVRINGIDYIPLEKGVIVVAAISPNNQYILSSNAQVKVGILPLASGAVSQNTGPPKPDSEKVRLASFKPVLDAVKYLSLTGGFPLEPALSVNLVKGGKAEIEAALKFPKSLFTTLSSDRAGGNVTLHASNDEGLSLEDLELRSPEIDIGGVRISDVYAKYNRADEEWAGGFNFYMLSAPEDQLSKAFGKKSAGAGLEFSPPPSTNGIRFKGGKLLSLGGAIVFGGTGLLKPVPIAPPYVYLKKIGLGVRTRDPFALRVDARIAISPSLAELAEAFVIDGTGLYTAATPSKEFTLSEDDAGETLKPLGGRTFKSKTLLLGGAIAFSPSLGPFSAGEFNIAGGYAAFTGPYVEFGGSMNIPTMPLKGRLKASMHRPCSSDPGPGCTEKLTYNAEVADASLSIVGIELLSLNTIMSSKGWAACGESGPYYPFTRKRIFVVRSGYTQEWGKDRQFHPAGCDVGDYRVPSNASAKLAAAGEAGGPLDERSVQVPDVEHFNVKLEGEGAAPRVEVTRPNGEQVSGSGEALSGGENIVIFRDEEADTTYVGFVNAAPGAYKIEAQPESAGIAGLEATAAERAKVKGSVADAPGKDRDGDDDDHILRYDVEDQGGMEIKILDLGPEGGEELETLESGGEGKFRFEPEGTGGRHRVVAHVYIDGHPTRSIELDTYEAPDPERPEAPDGLRLRRDGNNVKVSWDARKEVDHWGLVIKTDRGPREDYLPATRTKRSFHVPRWSGAEVSVYEIDETGWVGKPATKKLAPAAKLDDGVAPPDN